MYSFVLHRVVAILSLDGLLLWFRKIVFLIFYLDFHNYLGIFLVLLRIDLKKLFISPFIFSPLKHLKSIGKKSKSSKNCRRELKNFFFDFSTRTPPLPFRPPPPQLSRSSHEGWSCRNQEEAQKRTVFRIGDETGARTYKNPQRESIELNEQEAACFL